MAGAHHETEPHYALVAARVQVVCRKSGAGAAWKTVIYARACRYQTSIGCSQEWSRRERRLPLLKRLRQAAGLSAVSTGAGAGVRRARMKPVSRSADSKAMTAPVKYMASKPAVSIR